MHQPLPEPIFVAQFGEDDTEAHIQNKANEDLTQPEWNWCAICCVNMVLLGLAKDASPIHELYTDAFASGVYRRTSDGTILGAYHKELARFLQIHSGLRASAKRGITRAELIRRLETGSFCIASVCAELRLRPTKRQPSKNGHFVLVYKTHVNAVGQRLFTLHNSSGFPRTHSAIAAEYSEEVFWNCFSGNGIILHR